LVCGKEQCLNNVGTKVSRNLILDFIIKELHIDHFYIEEEEIILLRIDEETVLNPLIKEFAKNY
jgi:hypothetical protein